MNIVSKRSAALLLLGLLLGCEKSSKEPVSASRPRVPGLRITMNTLHQLGGTPPGWKLTPPSGDVGAGRTTFVDLGCPSCHRVEGESFSTVAGEEKGPDLTGMGAHHPPGYFAEAILNPDAVMIEGPGYIGADGHSTMPDYPDLTVRQLGDIVAYLVSLTTGGAHAGHVMPQAPENPTAAVARPIPPAAPATAYLIQNYDVSPEQLAPLEAWWKEQGAARFLAFDGLVSVDTYVDFARPQAVYTSLFGFRDEPSFQAFARDSAMQSLGLELDAFLGAHTHVLMPWPIIYRVPSLSASQ